MKTIFVFASSALLTWVGFIVVGFIYTILRRRDEEDDDELGGWGR